ncbi:hypothetical protein MRB53_041908 [Persea americana]|nr:hypothetical protein MRB53_041908 [Persea americana]
MGPVPIFPDVYNPPSDVRKALDSRPEMPPDPLAPRSLRHRRLTSTDDRPPTRRRRRPAPSADHARARRRRRRAAGRGPQDHPVEPLGHREIVDIMDEYYTADGCEDIRAAVEAGGEPLIPHVAALIARAKPISVMEYWALNRRKVAAQKTYLDRWIGGGRGRAAHRRRCRMSPCRIGNVAGSGTQRSWAGGWRKKRYLGRHTRLRRCCERYRYDSLGGREGTSERNRWCLIIATLSWKRHGTCSKDAVSDPHQQRYAPEMSQLDADHFPTPERM